MRFHAALRFVEVGSVSIHDGRTIHYVYACCDGSKAASIYAALAGGSARTE
jgi:hypothetical protein